MDRCLLPYTSPPTLTVFVERQWVDDVCKHNGRKRTFEHVEGNYPVFVYIQRRYFVTVVSPPPLMLVLLALQRL